MASINAEMAAEPKHAVHAVGDIVEIFITRFAEPNFDRACEQAYLVALRQFGCDESGNLTNVKGGDRSMDSIVVRSKEYRHTGNMSGQRMEYVFEAWVERNNS